jgi:TolB protein
MVDPVPSLCTVRPTVPVELERAIEKALAKVPADRYDTAGAFVEAAGAAAQIPVVRTRERRAPRRRVSPKAWRISAAAAFVGAAAAIAGVLLITDGLRGSPQITFSNIRQLTRAPEIEIEPAISPDGGQVAYTAGFGEDMHVYLRDLGGGRALPLTADRPGRQVQPRWTADGHSVLFTETQPGFGTASHLIPRLGGPSRTVGSGDISDLHDNRVVYIRRDSLLVRSIEGGEETFVAWVPPEPHSVAWSPDGSALAYVQRNEEFTWLASLGNVGPSSIWIVAVQGGEPVQVTDDVQLNVSPAWMPDGRHLLFVSDRDGQRDIYAVPLEASGRPRGRPERVTTGLSPHSISVSAEGSKVAYSRLTVRQNIWESPILETGSVPMSEATPVTMGNQIVEAHGVSRDGRWLAFDSNVEGNQDIYVMPVEGGEPRQVTSDAGDDMHPDFSPDGSEIVFYSARHGTRDVFLISTDGRDEVQLTDGPDEDYHPSFSPDGRWIAFFRWDNTGQEVYVMSRGSVAGEWSAPEQLTRRRGFSARWAPDGTRLVYWTAYGQIRTVSLDGEEQLLADAGTTGIVRLRWPDWSRDGRFVFFIGTDSTGVESLYAIPAQGGSPREVVRFDDPTKNVWPMYSLGEDRVYFSVREVESDIYVMDLEM